MSTFFTDLIQCQLECIRDNIFFDKILFSKSHVFNFGGHNNSKNKTLIGCDKTGEFQVIDSQIN